MPLTTLGRFSLRLGQRLRSLREAQGVSISDLGRLTGAHRSSISHIEAGDERPSFDMLLRLTRVLLVEPVDMFVFPDTHLRHQVLEQIRHAPRPILEWLSAELTRRGLPTSPPREEPHPLKIARPK